MGCQGDSTDSAVMTWEMPHTVAPASGQGWGPLCPHTEPEESLQPSPLSTPWARSPVRRNRGAFLKYIVIGTRDGKNSCTPCYLHHLQLLRQWTLATRTKTFASVSLFACLATGICMTSSTNSTCARGDTICCLAQFPSAKCCTTKAAWKLATGTCGTSTDRCTFSTIGTCTCGRDLQWIGREIHSKYPYFI